jgi:hypothetical protein
MPLQIAVEPPFLLRQPICAVFTVFAAAAAAGAIEAKIRENDELDLGLLF